MVARSHLLLRAGPAFFTPIPPIRQRGLDFGPGPLPSPYPRGIGTTFICFRPSGSLTSVLFSFPGTRLLFCANMEVLERLKLKEGPCGRGAALQGPSVRQVSAEISINRVFVARRATRRRHPVNSVA